MFNLQIALNRFFEQFTPLVFTEGYAMVKDAQGNMSPPGEPYITYGYSTSDIFVNTLLTFQIWVPNASNFQAALEIAGKIEKTIPVGIGTQLSIYDLDPASGEKLSDKALGAVMLYRGTPFIQPRSMDDQSLVVYYGNIEMRSHLI